LVSGGREKKKRTHSGRCEFGSVPEKRFGSPAEGLHQSKAKKTPQFIYAEQDLTSRGAARAMRFPGLTSVRGEPLKIQVQKEFVYLRGQEIRFRGAKKGKKKEKAITTARRVRRLKGIRGAEPPGFLGGGRHCAGRFPEKKVPNVNTRKFHDWVAKKKEAAVSTSKKRHEKVVGMSCDERHARLGKRPRAWTWGDSDVTNALRKAREAETAPPGPKTLIEGKKEGVPS